MRLSTPAGGPHLAYCPRLVSRPRSLGAWVWDVRCRPALRPSWPLAHAATEFAALMKQVSV